MRFARLRLAALLTLAAAAALAAPAAALAGSSDAAATQAYVQANLKLVQVARSHIAASERAPITQVLAKVRQECPHAGASSPQDENSTHMSYEVIGSIVLPAYRPDFAAMREYARAVAPLHWSNHAITGAVQAHAAKLKTLTTLAAPRLCADVRAWGANGFQALPASTVQFDQTFEPAWVAIGELPEGLTRFESPAVRSLVRETKLIEARLFEGEAIVTETAYESIMDELSLWP